MVKFLFAYYNYTIDFTMLPKVNTRSFLVIPGILFTLSLASPNAWESKFINVNKDGTLNYIADEKGNIIPDFSLVGYYERKKEIPGVAIIKTIVPSANGSSEEIIQSAIDEVAKISPDKNGFRGTILLKKGTYNIPGTVKIETGGIVLRGEGNDTKLVATGTSHRTLISVSGRGTIKEIPNTRTKITDAYVPVGTKSFTVASSKSYKIGDSIIVYRPATDQWIKDLKMDQIAERNGTKQWKANEYNIQFERTITKIQGDKIFIDNPIVMAMETKYGAPEIYKYNFDGRISNVGIENLYCESEYKSDTAEDHGWETIKLNKIENGWVRNVTSRYFGYSCVSLESDARNITVTNCNCLDAKSIITGSRRYSFNNTGQMNLVMNCHTTEGRHDYVTGARTRGPNVFYNCTAKNTHADIGPHHRWSMGTLYDNIITDGEINIQDRGNYGSGHGWVGVTQILWNCTVKRAAVQSPYVNGKNYSIGLQGGKYEGRFSGRPDGEWEGQNKDGLQPQSLYEAQLKEVGKKIR
ncbi:MAG: hypothetical protein ABI594_09210 [Ginsengibacter sp.]